MTHYVAELSFPVAGVTPAQATAILEDLEGFHAAVAPGPARLEITMSFPAESPVSAQRIALDRAVDAVASRGGRGGGTRTGVGTMPTFVAVMTEDEFDQRESFDRIPDLLTPPQAADILGVSQQRVRQMIDEGKFLSAQRVGERTIVIARAEVEAMHRTHVNAASGALQALADNVATVLDKSKA